MIYLFADDPHVQSLGRIGEEEGGARRLIFPASYLRLRFLGSSLQVLVENHHDYWNSALGVLEGTRQSVLPVPESGASWLSIPLDPDATEHDITLFKRQDACNEVTIQAFLLDEEAQLLDPPALPDRRIEVFGDSVSAGECCEALFYRGQEDPEHEGEYSNSFYSWPWITARHFHAQLHDIAQGGIALLPHTGYYHEDRGAIGMCQVFDKVQYNEDLGPVTRWDFTRYTPDVVIVALGQNDCHPEWNLSPDNLSCWESAYEAFLCMILRVYPDCRIVCATGIIRHDGRIDEAIEWVVRRLDSPQISHLLFTGNGKTTPGHPRIPEQQQMAKDMIRHIESLGIWPEKEKSCGRTSEVSYAVSEG